MILLVIKISPHSFFVNFHYVRLGYQPRNNRSWTASRRTLTDSGVSDSENPGSTMHLYKEK